MWREAGWHPKCRLFAARVRSPCAGTIVLSKRVITSTVLQVFAVALERWSDLESQPRANSPGGCLWLFLAVHSRRWLLTGVGSSGLPCLWRFFNAAMGRETNWRVAVVSGFAREDVRYCHQEASSDEIQQHIILYPYAVQHCRNKQWRIVMRPSTTCNAQTSRTVSVLRWLRTACAGEKKRDTAPDRVDRLTQHRPTLQTRCRAQRTAQRTEALEQWLASDGHCKTLHRASCRNGSSSVFVIRTCALRLPVVRNVTPPLHTQHNSPIAAGNGDN